jgi:glycosyltransferase involved in cell wall biosynthesis
MPTSDRPQFLKQALKYFMAQTYLQSELIIIDDGASPAMDAAHARNSRVKHIRLDRKTPLGTKLNIGISYAQGNIIQKLDDDDWYHPCFLETAISHLLAAGAEDCLAAWDCFMIYFSGESHVRFSGHGWEAGATFCFTRSVWDRTPFRDVCQAEDYWFKKDHPGKIVRVHMPLQFMAVRHGGNTWNVMNNGKMVNIALKSLSLRSPSKYRKPLNHFLSQDDVEFYYGLPPAQN